jgi:hypothetical protein
MTAVTLTPRAGLGYIKRVAKTYTGPLRRRRISLFEYDPDAAAYLAAVESTDGQALEEDVKLAINAFVVGCKADGIWGAIKALCILAGARTLAGALVPVVGAAPTNFNFGAEDYNRKTGLVGNGSTKYLNSNRNNNADPQDSQHMGVFPTTVNSFDQDRVYMGAGLNDTGSTYFFTRTVDAAVRNRSATANIGLARGVANSLIGMNRSLSTEFVYRQSGASQTISRNSETPLNANIFVFRGAGFTPGALSNARLAFYSIGESLDLALLDARVTTLISAIAAAIP